MTLALCILGWVLCTTLVLAILYAFFHAGERGKKPEFDWEGREQ